MAAAFIPFVSDPATALELAAPADDADPSQAVRRISKGRMNRIGNMSPVEFALQPRYPARYLR